MKIGMHRLRFFILLFAASSLLFQFPSEAFAATPSDITVTDTEIDGVNGFDELFFSYGVDTFKIGSSTYAIVLGHDDNGVQIIDISDPTNIVATDAETDGENGFDVLDGATGVETFTIGSSTYAIVTAQDDSGVQIIDISDPADIVAKDSETDGENGFDELLHSSGVDTFTIGSSTYAIVTGWLDSGVQIIDISDPADIVAKDSETDGENGFDELFTPFGVDTFTVGSSTYAIVIAEAGDGVQIIDISDPTNIVAKDSETDGENGFTELDGANSVDTFTVGSSTYAIVTSGIGDGVQIIDISDPTNIVATDAETDGENGFDKLDGAIAVDTFTVGSSTYAIVTSYRDSGVQIIDISDPADIVAIDAETDGENGFDVLDGATGVDIFTIGSSTYAIVTARFDNGVTIIELNTGTTSTGTTSTGKSGTCSRHVILGNCGTIAINNDEYRIINTWTNVPTTEVMVGEPVSITLSTHNYAAGKINSASVYTEIFGSPTNYEQSAHIDYSIMSDSYSVTKAKLFQVTAATHRITQDPTVKNLKMFEVVFTMVFAKPMETSHVVVETKNKFGIPETLYLLDALKVIERPIELLTMEEKSKFKIIYEPELKASLRPGMDPEPDMDMLVVDPEPVVSKATCGKGTMLKDNLCVANEMSFYFFINQFMRLFG